MVNQGKAILDTFGQKLIENVFDYPLFSIDYFLNKEVTITKQNEKFIKFYNSLDENQLINLKRIQFELMGDILFKLLCIFEENQEFQINFVKDNSFINLMTLSENLKGEPIFEDGWIDRFSKYRIT
jgi:hypothetical protein